MLIDRVNAKLQTTTVQFRVRIQEQQYFAPRHIRALVARGRETVIFRQPEYPQIR